MRIPVFLESRKWDICCLLCCAAAYSVNCFLLRPLGSFFRWYFSDLIAMPAILAYINLCLGILVNKEVASLKTALFITAICGLLWEVGAVWLKPAATLDPYDLLCYFIGTVGYWAVKSRTRKELKS